MSNLELINPITSWVGDRPHSGVLYVITTGLNARSELKAPFLNLISFVPFVVHPSGKMFSIGLSPFSDSCYLSQMSVNDCSRASFVSPLFKNWHLMEAAILPTPGKFLISCFETKLGTCVLRRAIMSIQLWWFATWIPAPSNVAFQSSPKYYL